MSMIVTNPKSNHIQDIRKIFQENGFDRTEDYNQHIYRDRQGESAVCCLHYHEVKLGALYAVVPARFNVHGKLLNCYQSLDTMVDKDFRGKGLFQQTAIATYENLEKAGSSLVYGFPNGNSYIGFKKYLGWKFLDPVPFLVRPINLDYFVKNSFLKSVFRWIKIPVFSRVSKNIVYSAKFPENNDLNDLCLKFMTSYKVGVYRDLAYLKDRYLSQKGKNYRYVTLFCSSRQKVLGFGIYCVEEKHGGKIGYIMDIIYNPELTLVAKKLISAILLDMKKSACDCVLAWCFSHSPSYFSYLKNLFVVLPEKIRPIELHFGFRGIGSIDEKLINNKKYWYLSYSDSDTV